MTTRETTRHRREDRRTSHDAMPNAWRLKACERCGGDLMRQVDEVGLTGYFCLQCGHMQNPQVEEQAFTAQASSRTWVA